MGSGGSVARRSGGASKVDEAARRLRSSIAGTESWIEAGETQPSTGEATSSAYAAGRRAAAG